MQLGKIMEIIRTSNMSLCRCSWFYFNFFVQKVESFLYKDVNVVITGNRDALTNLMASSGKVKGHNSPREQRGSGKDAAQRPGTPRAPVSLGLLSLML